MATGIQSQILESQVERLLKGDQNYSGCPYNNMRTTRADDYTYKFVQNAVEGRLLECPHSFHLSKIEIVPSPVEHSKSIFNIGFSLSEEHYGETDVGYIGKGVYLSSFPEYSAAYIKETTGITRFAYYEPVKVGTTCKLLGCIALVGRTKQLYETDYGAEIKPDSESHWAWVEKNGQVTELASTFFAQEYAIKETVHVYPRFRISLARVTREVVWVDPNIGNDENSRYVAEIKGKRGISLYATSHSDKALAALEKKKEGTHYCAVTAGRGGEDFVRSVRAAGIHCKVMVFCGAVAYHKEWSKKFSDVEVTNSVTDFKKYATWKQY